MEKILNQSSGRVIALMDVGTNSIRLRLVQVLPDKKFEIVLTQKEVVRLGDSEFVEQTLQSEAIDRAVQVCCHFYTLIKQHEVEEIIAIATTAVREAANRGEFIQYIKDKCGLDIRIISGLEEARLIYLGIASGMNLGDQQALLIDIGGGSTELIVGDKQQHYLLDSLKLGAIRLTNMFFLPHENEAVTPERYTLIQSYVRNTLVRTAQRIQPYKIDVLLGSSGTLLNLANITAEHFYQRSALPDESFTHQQLKTVISKLCELPLDQRRKITGIDPQRADYIVSGAAIIDTIMDELKLKRLQISDRGLLDGMLVDYLDRTDQSLALGQITIRERSVLQLGRTVDFDEPHARHVARLAMQLFESGFSIGLHKLGRWERELLEYAALLHDVGAFLSYQNHQMHTYYIVRNADLLGFDQKEISIIALAGLHHRKLLPSRRNADYAALDEGSQRAVCILGMMLRLAESLDRSHSGAIHRVRFTKGNGNEIILDVFSNEDCHLELFGVEIHKQVFEKTFHKSLVIRRAGNTVLNA